MRKYILLTATLALSLFLFGCSQDNPVSPTEDNGIDEVVESADAKSGGTARYAVTIRNLTPATGPGASQPFSPPILATHEHQMHIYRRGHLASSALAQLAEDAIAAPLLDQLDASPRVHDVTMGGGVVFPGDEMSFEIEADNAARRLSAVFMLVNTNDAFGGLEGVELPRHGQKTYMVRAWDAGSELNSEMMSDIPGPCCGSPGAGTDESRPIVPHRGILGGGELSAAMYDWDGAVAEVTVSRLD